MEREEELDGSGLDGEGEMAWLVLYVQQDAAAGLVAVNVFDLIQSSLPARAPSW